MKTELDLETIYISIDVSLAEAYFIANAVRGRAITEYNHKMEALAAEIEQLIKEAIRDARNE